MRSVRVSLAIPNRPPDAVFATLADFSRYPEFSSAVRSVTVSEQSGSATISHWEVNFRRGVLRWVEKDTIDAVTRQIHFRQLEGDVALFDGSWSCHDDGAGTTIIFCARLDMGIPSLADALEPIAARTLIDNTVAIVSGLFEGNLIVGETVIEARDPHTAPVG